MRELLSGLLRWRVKPRYYTFAIFSVLGVATLAVGIHILFGGSPPDVAAIAVQFGLPAEHTYLFIVISPFVFITTILVGGPIAEELGWRGYAQPRMQAQLGAGRAGLAIGFIWSLWHLPLFYYFPSAVAGLPLEYYVPLVTALGVPFAWLYNRTAGSVLLCILLHAGVNFALGVAGGTKLSGNRRLLTAFVGLMIILAFVMYLQIRSIKEVGSSSERGCHLTFDAADRPLARPATELTAMEENIKAAVCPRAGCLEFLQDAGWGRRCRRGRVSIAKRMRQVHRQLRLDHA